VAAVVHTPAVLWFCQFLTQSADDKHVTITLQNNAAQ